MIERVRWEELPAELRAAIEKRTGEVDAVETVNTGFNCTLAFRIHTRRNGLLFLKGVRLSDEKGMTGLLCEERINRAIGGIGAMIRHRFEVAGWVCLAFVHIEGRHIDYGPGTPDLGHLTAVLHMMHRLKTPAFPIPQLADAFAGYLKPGEAEALRGTRLLHTDMNPHNVLIGRGQAYVVDWAMPALGPPWVDAAYAATWLMSYGQPPEDALAWLNGFASWRQADRAAVETLVEVTCRKSTERLGVKDSARSNSHFQHLLDALPKDS
ncbi:phosphotransferase family protein [Streptomyces sp. NPDC003691]